jgi:hypothetical protein
MVKKATGFSNEGQNLFKKLVHEYQIEDAGGLAILRTAIDAFDRMKKAKAQIDVEGMAIKDKWGQLKAHPLCAVERDSRSQFLAALKQLNFDIEPLKAIGRPGE